MWVAQPTGGISTPFSNPYLEDLFGGKRFENLSMKLASLKTTPLLHKIKIKKFLAYFVVSMPSIARYKLQRRMESPFGQKPEAEE